MSFIKKNCKDQGIEREFTIIDTVALARILLPNLNRFKLDTVAKALNVSLENHHRAVDDAACTAEIFVKFIEMLKERGMENLDDVNHMVSTSPETVMKMPTYHAIILATNDIGRINLYRLVSLSHLTYYNKRPRVPKSEFVKYREGLLLGSACEAGELYRAIVGGRPQEEIIRLVKFYDYLEIQPLGNNEFMLRSDKEPVNTMEELQDINRRICRLGEEFNKLVVCVPIRIYQYTLSPWIGRSCRFSPSCSNYTMQAILTHGCVKGILLGAWRIARCNPLGKWGYDPVPPPGRWQSPARNLQPAKLFEKRHRG